MADYTEVLVNQIVQAATGILPGKVSSLAALEVAAGLYARAFAVADVKPRNVLTKALTPSTLASIGREIIRRGEAVYYLERAGDRAVLSPCSFWDITGTSSNPMEWEYKFDIQVPSGSRNLVKPGAEVIHTMYARENVRPWRGIGPLQFASMTGELAVFVESALKKEQAGPVANLIPVPQVGKEDGAVKKTDPLVEQIERAKGDAVLVRTTQGGWDRGVSSKPAGDWQPHRLGPNPPAGSISLRDGVSQAIIAACGVPVELVSPSDGTSMRESWRRFLHSSAQPLADIVSEELSLKLDLEIELSFDRLFASDIQGRARAFQSMVGGGMDLNKAAALSGLLLPGD